MANLLDKIKNDSITIASDFIETHPDLSEALDERQIAIGCMAGRLGLIAIPHFPTVEEHRKFLISVTHSVPWESVIFMTKNWIVLENNRIIKFVKKKTSEITRCVFSLILIFQGKLYISYSNAVSMELKFTDWIECRASADGESLIPLDTDSISTSIIGDVIEEATKIVNQDNIIFNPEDVIKEATKIVNDLGSEPNWFDPI